MKVRVGPAGVHIFDRATGLNVLVDEVRLPSSNWAVAPRQVSIALTNSCDLKCPYCYAPKHASTLDLLRLLDWLTEIDINGCLGVGFGGGEPTLYPAFAQLCHQASTKTGLAVTFTTHAHRLDDALVKDLRGSVHFLRVSIDGLGATYEKLRGRSFAVLRERLEAVRSLAPFGINFIVNADTLPDLDDAAKLAAGYGAAELLLLPEQPVRGRGGIDGRTVRAFRDWVARYRGTVPLTVSEAGSDGLPTCNPVAEESGLRAYAHIDASGQIKRSSFDSEGVQIKSDGVIVALKSLTKRQQERIE